jgi:hypothetical protein
VTDCRPRRDLRLESVACGVAYSIHMCGRGGQGSEGERPKEDESQESQRCCSRRDPATAFSNRRRDQTPEAKPLRQRCLCAESAQAPQAREGQAHVGLFEELVLGPANLVEVPKADACNQALCLTTAVGIANRKRGSLAERRGDLCQVKL